MTIPSEQLESEVGVTLQGILSRYESGQEINGLFNPANTLQIDPNIVSALQSSNYYYVNQINNYKSAPTNSYLQGALKNFGIETFKGGVQTLKDKILQISAELRVTSITHSIETSLTHYFNAFAKNIYVDKFTHKITYSEYNLTGSLNIPLSKFVIAADKIAVAHTVYESFKDPVVAAYENLAGQGNSITPVGEYSHASLILLGGGFGASLAAKFGGNFLAKAAGSAVGAAATQYVLDQVNQSMPTLVEGWKNAGYTVQQALAAAREHIEQRVDEFWALEGQYAEFALTQGEHALSDIFDAIEQLPENEQFAAYYDAIPSRYDDLKDGNYLEIDGKGVIYTDSVQIFSDNIYGGNTIHYDGVSIYSTNDGGSVIEIGDRGLQKYADGSFRLYYIDEQSDYVEREFIGFYSSDLTPEERDLAFGILLEDYRISREAAKQLFTNNPDILNHPDFENWPQSLKEELTALHEKGQAVQDEEAQDEQIIDGSFTEGGGDPFERLATEGLGAGAENWNVEQLVWVIQNGTKKEQIKSAQQLYSKIKLEGVFDPETGSYTLGVATIESVANAYGGTAVKVSYGGIAQSYHTFYDGGSFQQQVIETVGLDGRTNSAQITLGDTLVGQLYKGETIQINYPEDFVFGFAGGYVGGLVGQQLSNGELAHDIIVSSIARTLGSNLGEVLDFLAAGQNSLSASVFDPFFGVDGSNPTMPRPGMLDDFLANLQASVAGIVSAQVVEELGEAIGLDDGFAGEVFSVAAGTVTNGLASGGIDLVFKGVEASVYANLLAGDGVSFATKLSDLNLDQPLNVPAGIETVGDYVALQAANALGAFAGSRLAGELIEPESQIAAVFGAAGSAFATAISTGALFAGNGIASAFASLGWAGGPIGAAIGAFIGQVAGTVLGNLFGDDDEPMAGVKIRASHEQGEYILGTPYGTDGGDPSSALALAEAASTGVNNIIALTHGTFRRDFNYNIEIGYEGAEYFVKSPGAYRTFESSGDAVQHAALMLLKNADIVGGHAILMRAWHNSEAETLTEFQNDLIVAEAFQTYLLNPTGVIALMLNEPESEAAQQWAAVLQRAEELELHLPHEKDIDGGWGELLAARGDINPEAIPEIDGTSIVLTDPITGEEITLEHVIGPGYEIVRTVGTDGADTINVVIDGPSITYTTAGPGDDTFVGHDGIDIFIGGQGDDTADGGGGNDWLIGGGGNDSLFGNVGDDLLVGGEGDDTLQGGPGIDEIYGGGGNDLIEGNEHPDRLFGGSGNDTIFGNEGKLDLIYGGTGDDVLNGGGGGDYLYGGVGNDLIAFGDTSGNRAYIEKRDGHDVIEAAPGTTNSVMFGTSISVDELYFVRSGSDLRILILGEDQSVTIKAFFANSSNFRIFAKNGHHALDGLGGYKATANAIASHNASISELPEGQFNVLNDQALAEISGLYSWSDVMRKVTDPGNYTTTPIILDSSGGSYTYRNESSWTRGTIFAGAGHDVLTPSNTNKANNWSFRLHGGSGNDTIYGINHTDMISGGLGNDRIIARSGDDTVFGGSGNDDLFGQNGNDLIFGGAGNDEILGGNASDTLIGDQGDDTILGEDGIDRLEGNDGADIISGGLGNDILFGGEGGDALTGDEGDDRLFGENGNDTLDGGPGADLLIGGAGADIFVFGGFEGIGWYTIPGDPATAAMAATLTKIAGGASWNAGAYSQESYSGAVTVTTVAAQTNAKVLFGLSATAGDSSYESVNFAFYLKSNGKLFVYENGVKKKDVGSYQEGDSLTIERDADGTVTYLRNGQVLYTSATQAPPETALLVDVTILDEGGTLGPTFFGIEGQTARPVTWIGEENLEIQNQSFVDNPLNLSDVIADFDPSEDVIDLRPLSASLGEIVIRETATETIIEVRDSTFRIRVEDTGIEWHAAHFLTVDTVPMELVATSSSGEFTFQPMDTGTVIEGPVADIDDPDATPNGPVDPPQDIGGDDLDDGRDPAAVISDEFVFEPSDTGVVIDDGVSDIDDPQAPVVGSGDEAGTAPETDWDYGRDTVVIDPLDGF